ncbi:serine-aspartate repeat-containing protein F-like [Ostrea edulis]|uniref:serine-aspartate repeat-containing protein F-like n=1 Tax=Ostrea edulis TaxID=37623 RepID=UPI0024AFE1C8|nr:serine-aspartate repeat-containing protein F-like [Ostrea edulis]XP_056016479.1 serine-aspartate repeat-containing protein F-like [Ostrea edulis]
MNAKRKIRKRKVEESLLLNSEQRESDEKENFEAKFINEEIGQGVFAKKKFIEGEILLEYRGELIEGDFDFEDDTYVFQLHFKRKQFCIDATENRSFGRLLNDEHKKPNCKATIIEEDGKPHVYFVAVRDINTGEELRYNYGPGIYSWRTSKTRQRCKIGGDKDSKQGSTNKDSDSTRGATTKDLDSPRGSTTKGSHSGSPRGVTTKDSDSMGGSTTKDSHSDSTQGATTKDLHQDSTRGATTKDSDSTQGATTKDSHQDSTQGATTKDSHQDSAQGATTKASHQDSAQGATIKDSHQDSTRGATTKDSHSDSTQGATTKDSHLDSAQGATIKDSHQDSTRGATTKDSHSDSTQGATTKDSHQDSTQGATTKDSHQDSAQGATIKDSHQDSTRGATTKDSHSDSTQGATTKDSHQDSTRGATTKDSHQDSARGATTKDSHSDSTQGATTKDSHQDSAQGATIKDSDSTGGSTTKDSDSPQGATTKGSHSDSMRGATTKDADSMRGATTKDSDSPRGATTKDSDSPRGATTKDSDSPRGAITKDSDYPRGATTKDSDYPRGATTKDSDSTRGATTKDLDSDSMQGATTKDLDSDSMQGATTKDLDSDSMRGATTKKSDFTRGATTKDSRLEDVGMCLAKITVIKKDDSLGAIYHMNEEECVIGSGRECNIKVSLTNVDNIHAVVVVDRFKASVTNFSKKFPVILNGKPIEIGKELNDGDMLVIGGRKFLFNHKKSCNSHWDLFEDSSEHSDPFDPDYEMSEDADNVTSEDSCDEIIEEEVEHVSDSGSDVIPYQGPLQFLDQEETVSSTSELMALNSASKHQKQRATDFVIKNDIISSTVKDVEVQQSGNQDGIRVWDKVHYCVYCEKGFTNITKHYLGVHSNETDVQHIQSHPLKSTNRKLALMKLRNNGDFQHNYEVLRTRHGTLVTFTRNWNETSADQFLPCQYCLGFSLNLLYGDTPKIVRLLLKEKKNTEKYHHNPCCFFQLAQMLAKA